MAAGVTFGSKNEESVYRAFNQLKIEFQYQVPIDGGRSVRGGQVLDFVVYVPPRPVAVYVQGAYWHRNGIDEQLQQAEAERRGYRVVELLEAETMTVSAAADAIREKVL